MKSECAVGKVKTEGEKGHECKLEKVGFERCSNGFYLQ